MIPSIYKKYQGSWDFAQERSFTPLMLLIRKTIDDPTLIKNIATFKSADVNKRNGFGYSALDIACLNTGIWSSINSIPELLKICDINNQDDNGMTTLHKVAINCHFNDKLDVIKILLKDIKVNINIKDVYGNTFLKYLYIDNNNSHYNLCNCCSCKVCEPSVDNCVEPGYICKIEKHNSKFCSKSGYSTNMDSMKYVFKNYSPNYDDGDDWKILIRYNKIFNGDHIANMLLKDNILLYLRYSNMATK